MPTWLLRASTLGAASTRDRCRRLDSSSTSSTAADRAAGVSSRAATCGSIFEESKTSDSDMTWTCLSQRLKWVARSIMSFTVRVWGTW